MTALDSNPTGNPTFFRTYSRRKEDGSRESWSDMCDRVIHHLTIIGKLNPDEHKLINNLIREMRSLPAGRPLWALTDWGVKPENLLSLYNCTAYGFNSWDIFEKLIDLGCQGAGIGRSIERKFTSQIPLILQTIEVSVIGNPGDVSKYQRRDETIILTNAAGTSSYVMVGDSRQGWAKAMGSLPRIASLHKGVSPHKIIVDLSNIRAAGEPLKGFGGVANPQGLERYFLRLPEILNRSVGRQLEPLECEMLISEASLVIVAGNIRRIAGMVQGDADDEAFKNAKDNLWQQDKQGNWRIDPERDALRMANHSRVFHKKPSLQDCIDAVRKQYYSGEGAIQWAGEAVARANADILNTPQKKSAFLNIYGSPEAKEYLRIAFHEIYGFCISKEELYHRINRYLTNPCVTADTWVHTERGARQVKDLIGLQQAVYVNGELFSTTPEGFFFTGVKPVVKVQTKEGYSLRLTKNHQVLKVKTQTQKKQYSEWCEVGDLKIGDRIVIMNHRDILIWGNPGKSEFEKGYLLAPNTFNDIPPEIEQGSYQLYRGFLFGIFNKCAIVAHCNNIGVTIQLIQESLSVLESLQRMLLRVGICSQIHNEVKTLVIADDNAELFLGIIRFQGNKKEQLENLLSKQKIKKETFSVEITSIDNDGEEAVYDCTVPGVSQFDANGIVAHNCGEIIGNNFTCNLSEVQLHRAKNIEEAFKGAALMVASLLQQKFPHPIDDYSRSIDPIVGVGFTGLFEYFAKLFGINWLNWFQDGRPASDIGNYFRNEEAKLLTSWRKIVEDTVKEYCDRHNLRVPNRCTTVKPSGNLSTLTGTSPGWHPDKAIYCIRRITFRKNDPVALACIDYGYNVTPSQSDKDEDGNLLNDPYSDRCTEWLIEIPIKSGWADIDGAENIRPEKFSAISQFDFAMQCQKFYVAHNTSSTIELREDEIEPLGLRIYEAIQNDEGYISFALLQRFDSLEAFPRLPFEPISEETYTNLWNEIYKRKKSNDFYALITQYDDSNIVSQGPAGCDKDTCEIP